MLTSPDKDGPIGLNPSEVGVEALNEGGHLKRPILRAIRAKCLDCCVGSESEVRRCHITDCDLWPYRMGKNPFSLQTGNAIIEFIELLLMVAFNSIDVPGPCGYFSFQHLFSVFVEHLILEFRLFKFL